MPDSALPDATVLTSTFYDTYIREQVIVTCTSATRPTGVEGRMIYETDTDQFLVYNGAAWQYPGVTAWTAPTLSGTWVNVGGAAQVANYRRNADLVEVRGSVMSGTSATTVFTLPTGFRPPADLTFSTDGSGGYARLSVSSAGVVVLTGTTTSMSLNCSFSITT